MKILITIGLFLFVSFAITGQTVVVKGIIIDAENGDPLPYANIITDNSYGTTADVRGAFELVFNENLPAPDSIVVSYMGYHKKKVSINANQNLVVELKPEEIDLPDFVIRSEGKKRKQVTLNRFRKRDCFVPRTNKLLADELWIPYKFFNATVEAVYFPFENCPANRNMIKEVLFTLSSWSNVVEYKLRIIGADDFKRPAEDLLTLDFVNESARGDMPEKVDLSQYHIFIPENGIFIGIEMIDKLCNFNNLLSTEGEPFTLHSPFLNFFVPDELKNEYWIYAEGEWSKKLRNWGYENEIIIPAISLVVE